MLFNPHDGEVDFSLPAKSDGQPWRIGINTADPQAEETEVTDNKLKLVARSTLLLH